MIIYESYTFVSLQNGIVWVRESDTILRDGNPLGPNRPLTSIWALFFSTMRQNQGLIVVTQHGKQGVTKRADGMVDRKVLVYLDEGGKVLCDPGTLVRIGFQD